jgi:large conductance mechanosensitive channel
MALVPLQDRFAVCAAPAKDYAGASRTKERAMGMASEFKEFVMRGNVVDLAVGVVIGAAFGRIVTVLVDRVLMPPIGLMLGGVDFASWVITLKAAGVDAAGKAIPAVTIGIGEFFNALIQFLIVALAIFMVVKAVNRARGPAPAAAPPGPSEEVKLLAEIRDALRSR